MSPNEPGALEATPAGRPEFMAVLGLLPPYTVEDIHMAYRSLVRDVHPDTGGDTEQFRRLHEAYEHALEYAEFKGSRRSWLAARIEEYMERERVVGELRHRGGDVSLEAADWLRRSLGEDFAQVVYRVNGVVLHGPGFGDEDIAFLVAEQNVLRSLVLLDLSESRVTDDGLQRLSAFATLKSLILTATAVSNTVGEVVERLPSLEYIDVSRTQMTWWGRRRLRQRFPKLEVVD